MKINSNFFISQRSSTMKTLFQTSIQGLLLIALTLSGLRLAHAGSWEITYERSADYNYQWVQARHNGDKFETILAKTANVIRTSQGKETTTITNVEGVKKYDTQDTETEDERFNNNVYLNWDMNSYNANYFLTNGRKFSPGAKPGHSTAKLNTHVVFHWKRGGPDDNPPKMLYFIEHSSVRSIKTGTEFTFTGLVNPLGGTSVSSGDPNGYITNTVETSVITGIATNNSDTVTSPDRSFAGTADLDTSYENSAYPQGDASIDFVYDVSPLNLSLSATPVGPYDVVTNLPDNKVYNGTTRWAMKLTDNDGNFKIPDPPAPDTPLTDDQKTIHGEYIIDAESAFSAVAARPDGSPIFPNQKFIWKSTPVPDKPIPLYFSVDHQPEILAYKDWLNDQDHDLAVLLHEMGPGATLQDIRDYLQNGGQLTQDNGAIMSPALRDELLRNLEAIWLGSHPPDEQLLDTSTPTKDFSWTMGNADDYANFAAANKNSVVQAYVTGENADDPIIPVGKVKINWSRPKKCLWQVKIFPVTWRVPQGDGFVDLIRKVFSSNEELTEQMELWGGDKIGQIALSLVGAGGEAGAVEPTVINVTTAGDVTGQQVVDQALAQVKEAALDSVADDDTIPDDATGTLHAEADQKGDLEPGETPEHAEGDRSLDNLSNCFVAGTPVLMADGSLKSIEQVKVGDEVESKDPKTGQVSAKKVLRTFRNIAPIILSLTLSNGATITTTPGHPFATTQHGDFILAGHLPLKAQLQEFDGHTAILASETFLAHPTPIFNFEVEDFHTYFVGKSHIWVHNRSLEDAAAKIIKDAKTRGARMAADSHDHSMPQNLIDDTVSNPDNVYNTTDGRLVFCKGNRIVIVEARGSTIGQVVSTYGDGGVKGPSGVSIFGGNENDPSPPVTEQMVIDGLIQRSKGNFYKKGVLIIPTPEN